MTLILKLDLDVVTMYLHAENEISSCGSKVTAQSEQTDRSTDPTEIITGPHVRMVITFYEDWLREAAYLGR